MKDNILAENFVEELIAASLHNHKILDIAHTYLKYTFLQKEAEKKLWQFICKRYEVTGRIPTVGQIQQHFMEDDSVLEKLSEIEDIEIDEKYDYDNLTKAFEDFIKKMKFLEANDKIADIYNSGDKDKAYNTFVHYAEDFSQFSINGSKFERVFSDFDKRQLQRHSEDYSAVYKIPTCIDEIDESCAGGPQTTDAVLWLGESGVGKSQLLCHLGISSARQGYRVAHFQLEGTRKQCMDRYDSAWTGTLYGDMKLGEMEKKNFEISRRVIKKLKRSDIIVSSFEEFGSLTLVQLRKELQEMEKAYGKISTVLIDYLELLEVGDGIKYSPNEERFRQAKIAKGLKNIAMEFNCVVHAATQASNIPTECKNDPEFVINREYLNEDKGKHRPFDMFFTLNQTRDEKKDHVMRIFEDKMREYEGNRVVYICNNFSRARFYDRNRTLEMDWDEYTAS